jgi:hypothetical protein
MAKKPKRGRPAAGPRGEKRSEMRHQIAARVPSPTYHSLRALSSILDTSQADVLTRALDALAATLTPAQKRAFRAVTQARRES